MAEAEALAEKTYKMGWENAIIQMQHFFTDKDLNFAILNQEKFLHDMLSEGAQENYQDVSEKETLDVEKAQVEVQDELEVPSALIDDHLLGQAQATSAIGGGQRAEEITEAIIPKDQEAVGRLDE